MQYQYNSYVSLLIASTCTTLFLGMYALLKRRNVKGAKSFMLSMFVVTIWSTGNALEMSSLDFGAKLFWANLQYIAYCFSPVTLVTLTMQVTGYNQWVKNKRILWLALLPTIIIILVWTDPCTAWLDMVCIWITAGHFLLSQKLRTCFLYPCVLLSLSEYFGLGIADKGSLIQE